MTIKVTDEAVERACRMQHVGWSVWHEPQKKTAREIMRRVLEQFAASAPEPVAWMGKEPLYAAPASVEDAVGAERGNDPAHILWVSDILRRFFNTDGGAKARYDARVALDQHYRARKP